MSWVRKLLAIDRRIIFLLVAVGVVLPLLRALNLPVTVTPRVQAAFDAIDALPPGSKVLISMDYEPDIMAELMPMSIAVMRHCFRKHLHVIAMTLYPAGTGLGSARSTSRPARRARCGTRTTPGWGTSRDSRW